MKSVLREMRFLRKLRKRFQHDNLDSEHPRPRKDDLVTIQEMERIMHFRSNSKSFCLKVIIEAPYFPYIAIIVPCTIVLLDISNIIR